MKKEPAEINVRVYLHIHQIEREDTYDECELTVKKTRGWKYNAKCEASKRFFNHLFTGTFKFMKVEEI